MERLEGATSVDQVEAKAAEIFSSMDLDGNGRIDHAELKAALLKIGVSADDSEVTRMILEADENECAQPPLAHTPYLTHVPYLLPSPFPFLSIKPPPLPTSDNLIDLKEFQSLMKNEAARFQRKSGVCVIS